MIFSPQVEVRLNSKKTRLTGFIAGMGPQTVWDKPQEMISRTERTAAFYPEHDLEVKLDINISNQDISTVNKLRYRINEMLSKTKNDVMCLTQPKLVNMAQKEIKKMWNFCLKLRGNTWRKNLYLLVWSTGGICSSPT